MSRPLQFASFVPVAGLRQVLALACLVFAGSIPLLQAQNSVPAAPAALPDEPLSTAKGHGSTTFRGFPVATTYEKPIAFRMEPNPMQPAVPSFEIGTGARIWSQPAPDPFQPDRSFGYFTGSDGLRLGFYGGGTGINADGQLNAGFNRYGGGSLGEHQGNPAPLFPFAGGQAGGYTFGAFGATAGSAPSFSQLMHGSTSAPLTPNANAFRFSYQTRFSSNSNGTGLDFNRMIATGMFTTPDLGNGMHFSAGSGYGMHSMGGSPTSGVKGTGPTVAIKLQF